MSSSIMRRPLGQDLKYYTGRMALSGATAPKTFRMPEEMVFRLERLARQLNTTAGRLIIEMLKDLLPAFEKGKSTVRLAVIDDYKHKLPYGNEALVDVDLEKLFAEVREASNFSGKYDTERIKARSSQA